MHHALRQVGRVGGRAARRWAAAVLPALTAALAARLSQGQG
jgi:hypothetical protein